MSNETDIEKADKIASQKAMGETKKAFPPESLASEQAKTFWMKVYWCELMRYAHK